jgi:prepilin-type N-terminal cleavage/methylation domain-containing protein
MLNINSIYSARKSEKGFTLIELSIVLVIIGLIVGGILTGQDLIKAAEQRATLAQVEKYNTAVNTFRNKFTGVPGDLSSSVSNNFGLYTLTAGAPCATLGTQGCQDGNGLVEQSGGGLAFNGEPVLFWRHLSDAGLIDGAFVQTIGASAGAMTANGAIGAATGASAVSSLFPIAKLGRNNYITVGTTGGINYYVLSGMGSSTFNISTAGAITAGATNNLTALESYSMDKKVDDGLPETGSVVVLDASNATGTVITTGIATAATVATCDTATAYVVNPGTTPSCSLRFKFN